MLVVVEGEGTRTRLLFNLMCTTRGKEDGHHPHHPRQAGGRGPHPLGEEGKRRPRGACRARAGRGENQSDHGGAPLLIHLIITNLPHPHPQIRSNYLRHPLNEELDNEEIFLGADAIQVVKYHGSYQQDNREQRKGGEQKKYSFMLRLKSPAGEVTPELYKLVDDLCTQYGQNDLRATTRQCFQIHGILKGNLKTVISGIMNIGSSTVGACGDVVRNVGCTPAPFTSPAYAYAREYSKIFAELFKPQTTAFSEIWLGDEKAASVEYWKGDISKWDIETLRTHDNGNGIIVKNKVEPLYGDRYLPRKFKVSLSVPGDNSVDLYTNDIGLVVIVDKAGNLEGFNVMVGGGMGRTHNKEQSFARAADHMGFVAKDDIFEAMKAIVAAQRDHGNREVRMNARMKYLVHNLGIDKFRELVEGYFGKKIAPWRAMEEWQYMDWMGWHEQGDGNLFLGISIENGRIKDFENGPQLKTLLRKIVDKYNLAMIMSPAQSLIFKDIKPADKAAIDALMAEHKVLPVEAYDPITRHSMACPALPLCGLAITEAERVIPDLTRRLHKLLDGMGLGDEQILTRMTGCPNGCARPYMAELAFVGDGPNSYQVWLGGSPVLTRTAFAFKEKVKMPDIEAFLTPIFAAYKKERKSGEAFGDWTHRVGKAGLESKLA